MSTTTKRPKVTIEAETWEDVYYVFDLNSQILQNRVSLSKDEAEDLVAFELEADPSRQFDILQGVKWDSK